MRQADNVRSGATPASETDFGYRRVPEAEKPPLVRARVRQRRRALRPDERPDERRHPPLWKDEMVAWLNPRPGQRMLDVAGGTGDVALPRAAAAGRRRRRLR